MTPYKSESEVETVIKARLSEAGCNSRVSVYSDSQSENTVIRTVVFKTVVSLEGSEAVINKMAGIGTDTDRTIAYRGSQVEPGDGGEIRILFFEAKINPYEG